MECRPWRRGFLAADCKEGRRQVRGFRTIILFWVGGHSFFVHGFAKNEKADITPRELKALRALATLLLNFDGPALQRASAAGEIIGVSENGEGKERD